MIRRTCFVWLLCSFCSLLATQTGIHPFFKNIHTNHPSLAQLEFQLSANNHASAFFILTHWLNQNLHFSHISTLLPTHLRQITNDLIEVNTEEFNLSRLLAENPDDLEFFVSLGSIMAARFDLNHLSGAWAEKCWVLLYERIDAAFHENLPSYNQAAILHLAKGISFFNKAPQWHKKEKKMLSKLIKAAANTPSELARVILGQ